MFSISPSAMSRELDWGSERPIYQAFSSKDVKNMLADREVFKNIIIAAVNYYLKLISNDFFRSWYKKQAQELKEVVLESKSISEIIDILESKIYSPALNYTLNKNAFLKYCAKKIATYFAGEHYNSIFYEMIATARHYLKPFGLKTFTNNLSLAICEAVTTIKEHLQTNQFANFAPAVYRIIAAIDNNKDNPTDRSNHHA